MRMVSFLVDKAFNILSDDKHPAQYDAAAFLKRVRAVNPELVSSYVSELMDAKAEKALLSDERFIVPNYIKYPASEKSGDDILIYADEADRPAEGSEAEEIDIEQETEKSQVEDNLLSWDLFELIKFNILKNLTKISFEEIDSPIKKCALGDGKFDRSDTDIWKCTECGTAYHSNCAKIVAILEGRCRICEVPFLVEEALNNEDPPDNNEKTEN